MTELRCTVHCPNFVQQYICAYHLNLELAIISSFCTCWRREGEMRHWSRVKTVLVVFEVVLMFWALSGGGGMDFSLLALAHIQLWDSTLNQPCFSSYTSLLRDALLCSNGYGFCWFSLNSVTISRFSRGFLLLLVFQTCFRYKRPKYRDFKGLELQLQQ